MAGHSDGDAVAHAVTDAVLGAACAGDVGTHFPPGDERFRDADSIGLLREAAAVVAARGMEVSNVDVTVVCESPRIAPVAEEMRSNLAGALGIAAQRVSVKGKSNEGLGWIGRGEGLAAFAVALVRESDSGRARGGQG